MSEVEKILNSCRGEDFSACQATCPANIDAKGYIAKIAEGDFRGAIEIVREVMPFVGACGRVCNHPCEAECERGNLDEPVAIRALKRFIADYEIKNGREKADPAERNKEERVAVIGSGPAGLTCAYHLVQAGYDTTVFEALPKEGGLLRYGIPAYRLPDAALDNDIAYVKELGVEIETSRPVRDLEEIFARGYKSVFLGVGAWTSRKMGIEGEDAEGIIHAIEFLTQVNSNQKADLGDRVAVIGGGNAAIDSVRAAYRMGAKQVSLVYRRSLAEMPADKEEIEDAEQEGIDIHLLAVPVKFLSGNGRVQAMECIRMELGEPDESGRRRPVPIAGSEFTMDVDSVIIAISQSLDQVFLPSNLDYTKWGTVAVDPVTLETNIQGVFAGGDAVLGPATVIEAVAAGKEAAISIDRYLRGTDLSEGRSAATTRLKEVSIEGVEKKSRVPIPKLEVTMRDGFAEVEQVLDEEAAIAEAKRCLVCECKECMKECEFLRRFCDSPKGFTKSFLAGDFNKKTQAPFCCNLCEWCEKVCPEEINVGRMCIEARRTAVEEGVAPLAGHKILLKDQEFVRSSSFTLMIPTPEKRKVRRVFFPGCHLSSYRPSIVISTYEWLRKMDPDTGIILRCCGAPTNGLGFLSDFKKMMADLEADVERMGAEEIIPACPNCFRTMSRLSEKLNPISLYDVMSAEWKEGIINTAEGAIFNLHDPCAGRFHTSPHDNVRQLIEWTGAKIEELDHIREDTRCCGMGGMVAFTSPELAGTITKRRVAEAPLDLVTYCATCQGSLAAQKPTLHILDLIFNPKWQEDKALPPNKPPVKKENQIALKNRLQEKYHSEI